ncbi:putative anti-sigma factor antagonist BtrV [uncultured Desulfatiglans sp.]|uniref:Anti-sigma factor antagonist n=1 Tax=Uncultured Desulfatiglans sp. TaxID=1748965 RepID=A0A653AHA5_UNCDX|nr:putative anti-sigma factor antagonist BtrV [uncultured Desulfatiglans sp.]
MEIRIDKNDQDVVVSIIGRMDAVTAPDFDQEIEKKISEGEKRFVVDLSQLEYISSAGLRSMLSMAKKLKQNQGTLALCGLKGVVKEVFDVSGFSSIFSICEDVQKARKAL